MKYSKHKQQIEKIEQTKYVCGMSPYHFGSTKSKSIVKQICHVLLLCKQLKLWVIIYCRKICLTRPILVLIPKCGELLLEKVPCIFYCPQDPQFICLVENMITDIKSWEYTIYANNVQSKYYYDGFSLKVWRGKKINWYISLLNHYIPELEFNKSLLLEPYI